MGFYHMNQAFSKQIGDSSVTALTLYGNSAPGSYSLLEYVVHMELTSSHPLKVRAHLPVGAKAGDEVGFINLSVLWWNGEGKIDRELEYGRFPWKDSKIGMFDAKA